MFIKAIINGQVSECPIGWNKVTFNFTDYYVANGYRLVPDGIETDWLGLSVPKAIQAYDSAGDLIL